MNRRDINRLVTVLEKACSPDTLARIVDNLLCADAQPSLTDGEVALAESIFDRLTERNPGLVEAAQDLT